MLPRWHVLLGFVFSYMLVYFFDFSLFAGLIIFLSSIFIDLDHVVLYFLEKKNLHPLKFLNWSKDKEDLWRSLSKIERERYKEPHMILHGIEFIILLIIFSFYYIFFLWILYGILFHLFLDFVDLYNKKDYHHFSQKASQFWVWKRNQGKKDFFFNSFS